MLTFLISARNAVKYPKRAITSAFIAYRRFIVEAEASKNRNPNPAKPATVATMWRPNKYKTTLADNNTKGNKTV